MEEVKKHINDTNACYRSPNAGDAKNTDLFLDNDHYDYFKESGDRVVVRFNKENLAKAILFIASILPRKYDNSATHMKVSYSSSFVYEQLALLDGFFMENGIAVETKTQTWNPRKDVPKKNGEIDNRFYFNGLIEEFTYIDGYGNSHKAKFTLRNYLAGGYSNVHFKKADDGIFDVTVTNVQEAYYDDKDNDFEEIDFDSPKDIPSNYRPYITAIKSKPFLLLAGISGTGKSRIVRELAHACWDKGTPEYKAQKPKNFEMIQVKPNWHDSSELIGYVSRVSGTPEFVAGDFLKFVVKAWENPDVPHFLCLDEMNLAPVEQYFAEYLSVIESRKSEGGVVVTDPLLKKVEEGWYFDLTAKLTRNEEIRLQFNTHGISIPQNLIVVGTVNMDETTFSFSRKVLDRAMTIEMNEVNLNGGLTERHEPIGLLGKTDLVGTDVEGVDVYERHKDVCDNAIEYLKKVNAVLEGTPFKVAYRTRNEFLLYVVNNLPYKKDDESKEVVIQRALDEITSMKVLSRIEGDETKVSRGFLTSIEEVIRTALTEISPENSVSLNKLKEMKRRLESGYTSFWS